MRTLTDTQKPARAGRIACANEGCPRAAQPGELLCETCALERSLFRRDERWNRAAGEGPPAAPR